MHISFLTETRYFYLIQEHLFSVLLGNNGSAGLRKCPRTTLKRELEQHSKGNSFSIKLDTVKLYVTFF